MTSFLLKVVTKWAPKKAKIRAETNVEAKKQLLEIEPQMAT
jgi:hypothetical protein